ncbi:MAG TPA: histidinol-phosphate transaminase [Terriglobia bacterium]|nr:histidinol-phosphate transaminase [Terriglobia bacterium]
MIRPRKAIERLQKYRPPLEGRGGKLRLDFNENTVGCAPEVIRALRRGLSAEGLTRYPEYDEARTILARYFKVAKEEILLTNGTDDAIKMICDAFVDPGDVLLQPSPTFPVYKFFHEVAGGEVARIPYDENFRLPLDQMLSALKKRPRWLALANPNNPTGTVIPQDDLRTILRAAPRTVVLVDEAYFDFSGETVLPWIRKYSNLVVTRTFSKAFGLAALRMGCIFANVELAECMHRGQNPFAVNSLAMAAACEAIRHPGYVRRYADEVRANRKQFCRLLEVMGIPFVPSSSNFVLTLFGEHAPEIGRRLRKVGILVRDWSYDPHLRGYLRITIGSTKQSRRLVKALRKMEPLLDLRDGARAWKNFVVYSSTGWFA